MRRIGVLVMVGAMAWAGCGGSDGPSKAELQTYARTMSCIAERATVQTAMEAYRAMSDDGRYPSSTSDVIPDYLRREPTWWEVQPRGRLRRINTDALSLQDCNMRTKRPKDPLSK